MRHILRISIGLTVFSFLVKCTQPSNTPENGNNLEKKVENNKDTTLTHDEKYAFENLMIEFDEAIIFQSTNNIAIPLIYDEVERDKLDYERTFFNIAIITDTSATPVMAFSEPVIIKNVLTIEPDAKIDPYYHDEYYEEDEMNKPLKSNGPEQVYDGLIFLETHSSYNHEENFTNLWVYDLNDLSLEQLNPDLTHVLDWHAIGYSGKILVHYLTDSDQDGIYNEDKDDHNMCVYNVIDHTNSGKLFDLEFLRKMKAQVVKSH